MNFIRISLFGLVFLGFSKMGYSQDTKSVIKLSVAEAQNYALQNNRSVQSAKLDVNISNKKVWETIAVGLPQLSLAASYQHQFVVPELNFGPSLDPSLFPATGGITRDDFYAAYKSGQPVQLGVKNNTTFDFTLSQLIFSGEYIVGLQATRVFKMISEKALVKTESQTKESVAGTYSMVLVLGESIKVLNQSLNSISKTFNDLSKMNQQGLNEETDVDQIKISMSNIKTLVASLESQKEVSMKLLKFQLGMDFNQSVELTDTLPGLIRDGNIQYLTTPVFNLEKSVDYQIISNMEEASALTLKREQSKYLPQIAAFYRRHEQTNSPSFNFQVKDVVGVSLNLPIYQSGQRSSRVSQAKFDLEKSKLNRENTGQALIMEFESAQSSYQTAYNNFIINKESMELSKKVYERTIIKYHEGVSSSFDLTQSQNQFLTSESTYYTYVLTLLNAKAKLDRILESK